MLKARKYRLYPSEAQKTKLDQHFSCCRLVWNLALEVKQIAWRQLQETLDRRSLEGQLLDLKKEFPWLYEINAQSLQGVISNLEKAFQHFYNGGGYPKFKKKGDAQSFQCPQGVRVEKNAIVLPKVRKIRCEGVVPFDGLLRTVTISKTITGKYYASVLIETSHLMPPKPIVNPEKTIGIDVGIKSMAVTSDGHIFEPGRYFYKSLNRLKCLQRRASRKKKGSNNRKKANLCVAKLHEKIHNQRVDYCHKITTGLIRDNQTETFVIEDLAVVNMLKNKRLSKSIADVSFGEFFRQMKYKCDWYGKNLIIINRFSPSSKTCSFCGSIKSDMTLSDRKWACKSCGTNHDRDFNAAINIKRFGLEQYSRRGTPNEPVELRRLRRAKKQEKYFLNNI